MYLKRHSLGWIVMCIVTFLFFMPVWRMPVQAAAANGQVAGFVGDICYRNGKVQRNKAVRVQGSWYVLDGSGTPIRGRTIRMKGASYRLREDGTAYTGTWMFGNRFYVYGANGKLNRARTKLLNRYRNENIDSKKKPFSKVKNWLGKVVHHWKIRGCGGKGYFSYYYYENGFLVVTEVYGKKSYFSYAEDTPWDPSLMDE